MLNLVLKVFHGIFPFAATSLQLLVLQSLWSLSLAIVDVYALLVGRCLNNHRVVSLFAVGDGVS